MNKFDEFVEAADKELHVDTSTRNTTMNMTPSGERQDSRSPTKSSSGEVLSRKEMKMKQFSPKKLNYSDHPLKEHNSSGKSRKTSTSTINKRKSLLQPMVTPQTPDKSGGSWVSNAGSPSGSVNNDRRSTSIASMHSRSSSQSYSFDSALDISLQNLANKELELLEIKRHIEELKKQLQLEEQFYHKRVEEVKELKSQVSNNLQVNTQQQQQQQHQHQNQHQQHRHQQHLQVQHGKRRDEHNRSHSRRTSSGTGSGSVWSKPLAFFNQFDQIIQHELERSLRWDDTPEDKIMHPEPYEGAAGVQHNQLRQAELGVVAPKNQPNDGNSNNNISSNNKNNNNNNNISSDEEEDDDDDDDDGSTNIWNFFNDVKTGLLGIEEEEEVPQRTIAGSAKAENGIKEFKTAKKKKDPVEMTDFRK